ncbi:hypothetical protein AAAZ42_05175 [Bacteroides ovatus]|nr:MULTISPECIES: hypothetical protein [Bacteroides]MDC2381829.1 hypothetical protein [Bacteroides ovatus]
MMEAPVSGSPFSISTTIPVVFFVWALANVISSNDEMHITPVFLIML